MNFTVEGLKQKYENKKKNAKSRNIGFDLTEDEFIKLCLFLKENKQCAYTGDKFVFTSTTNGTPKPDYPTLERYDNNLGYTIGNCIWVYYHANFVKSKWESNNYNRSHFQKMNSKPSNKFLAAKIRLKNS